MWGYSWWACLLPIVMTIATFIATINVRIITSRFKVAEDDGILQTAIVQAHAGSSSVYTAHDAAGWAKAQTSLALCMNVISTGIIAGRIYWQTRDLRNHSSLSGSSGTRQYYRAISIVIESALLAAIAQTLQLGFYVAKFPGSYFTADSTQQLMSITPMLTIVFVGLSRRHEDVYTTTSASSNETATAKGPVFRRTVVDIRDQFPQDESYAAHSQHTDFSQARDFGHSDVEMNKI